MRKIRGWDSIRKEMIELCPAHFDNDWSTDGWITPLMSTGLKTIDGEEIYEGDILDIGKSTPATLEWCDGAYELLIDGKFECRLCVQDIKEVKIIGNTFANPELLQPPQRNDYEKPIQSV
jgi:hypothetical protein